MGKAQRQGLCEDKDYVAHKMASTGTYPSSYIKEGGLSPPTASSCEGGLQPPYSYALVGKAGKKNSALGFPCLDCFAKPGS